MSHETEPNEQDEKRIVVIGITGNIGCGKSEVATLLRAKGCTVLSSDETAKRLMNENAEVRDKLKEVFGIDVFTINGTINKEFLAKKVFGASPDNRKYLETLNSIVHPAVLDEHVRQIREFEQAGLSHLFIESALIYEVEIEDAFDYIVVVDAPEDVRIARAMQRDKGTEAQIRARMENQLDANQKKSWADFTIDNSGTKEQLETSVNFLYPIFLTLPPTSLVEDEE